ncbi:MAG: glycosyltransferase [Bacteroidetes bacterium]|nr:MAG: glycosyltransferase [Bacteroidota bacterium]
MKTAQPIAPSSTSNPPAGATPPMRILQVFPTYKPAYVYGGPIFSVSYLCEQMVRQGHEVELLTTTANGPDELDVETGVPLDVDGVRVYYFRRWTKDHTHFSPALLWHLWKNCRRYDVVHIQSWWNTVVILSVVVCWLRGVRPVLSPRGMLSGFSFSKSHASLKHLFHRHVGRRLLRRTVCHVTSPLELEECKAEGLEAFLLPNLLPLPAEPPPRPPSDGVLRLAFLSRIHPKKNLEGTLQALSLLDFPFELHIAGSGEEAYLEELKTRSRALGLEERVNWVGHLHGTEKFEFLARADVFLLLSHNENFANVVIEALSVGTPVLVSEGVGLSAFVREEGLGWVTDLAPESIAAALSTAFEAPSKREEIRRRGPALIQERFSAEKLVPAYIQAYREHLRHESA